MGRFVQFLREDTDAATVDWMVLSAGIVLLGALTVYQVFVGATNELVAEMNQSLGEDQTIGGSPSAGVGSHERLPERPAGECEELLEAERSAGLFAACRLEDRVDE